MITASEIALVSIAGPQVSQVHIELAIKAKPVGNWRSGLPMIAGQIRPIGAPVTQRRRIITGDQFEM
jgi:hypothetical protein